MRVYRAALVLGLFVSGAVAEGEPRRDRYGDPLPDGATMRLGTIRQRVVASQLAISADGRTVITVAAGRAVARWDAATGRLRSHRLLPGRPRNQCWLSADGRLLAVNEDGKSLAVFDTESGARKHLLAASAMHAAFRADGKVLATGEYEKSRGCIRLWDLATGKDRLLAELPSYVNALAFSPDGKSLFAAVDNHSLRCWVVASGKEVWKNGHSASRLTVTPDGRTLCSNTYQQPDMHLWDAGTGRRIGGISTGKNPWIGRLAFAPDGRTGFAVDYRDLLVWNPATRSVQHRLASAGYYFAVAPDSKTVMSIGGSLLRRWDVETGTSLYPDTADLGHTDAVCGLAFAPDGRSLVTSGADNTIRLWELATQRPRTLLTGVRPRFGSGSASARSPDNWRLTFFPLQSLGFTANGRRLLSETNDGQLRLTDIGTGEEVRRFDIGGADKQVRIGSARLSSDGRTLWALTHHSHNVGSVMYGAMKEALLGWDVTTGRRRFWHSVVCSVLEENVIAPDGHSVGLAYGGVRDVEGEKSRLKEGRELNFPFAFSADSRLVAAADPQSQDRWDTIAVHELLTGRRLVRLEAPISWSSRFAFSPDGRLLIASGADALHVWEVSSGRRLLHLPAEGRLPAWLPGSFATCLAVAPDGRSAATGHEDGTVLLWDLGPAWRRLAERPAAVPSTAELDACWADLLREEARTAYAAMDRLTAAPTQSLPLLRKHLRPVKVSSQWLADRLAALDSSDFAVREKASRDLAGVVESIRPQLRHELEQTTSLEARSRLRRILEVPHPSTPPAETVRQLRAVAVLEQFATPDAHALLRELAKGEAGDRLTIAAKDALARLTTASATPPNP